jgi:3-hydroxy-9,10-secoandrosta-1,3,5(10)-triene-9,17-dione monooxygenase reductase component
VAVASKGAHRLAYGMSEDETGGGPERAGKHAPDPAPARSPSRSAGGASVSYGNPWADPPEARDPLRRLRGRLALPVTVWLAGVPGQDGLGPSAAATRTAVPGPSNAGIPGQLAGLTVSSVVVAQGEPAKLAGLLSPTADLTELITQPPGPFVVHILNARHRRLAKHFAGELPAPPELLVTRMSAYGPVLVAVEDRLFCRTLHHEPFGMSVLVQAAIESVEVGPAGRGLAWYHGGFAVLDQGRFQD